MPEEETVAITEEQQLPETYVELADGTILDADLGQYTDTIWIWYRDGTGLVEAANMLGDPEKTAVVTYVYPGVKTEYMGYTRLTDVILEEGGNLKARLRRQINE